MASGAKPEAEKVTVLLRAWREGDGEARERLIPIVYPQLRALASRYMNGEAKGHTLSATALVHEAYIKLVEAEVPWADRLHFFAVAARVMRHILVDHAKARQSQKRGGGAVKLSLDDVAQVSDAPEAQLIDLDEALRKLSEFDPRKAELVEMVYFGGLNQAEAAGAAGISEATVSRELRVAKAWLHASMAGAA